jgi:hypothetical protein
LIVDLLFDETVPAGNSVSIGVHDENGPVESIKQNTVGGLRAHAVD